MGKLLRVLVIVILILTIVSLFFANMLFAKRELLTRRNSVLEDQVVKLAKTIEAADAADAAAPVLQKDISEVSDRELANPEKESVLEGYPAKLEQQNLPTLDYGSTEKRLQLRSFYVLEDGKYKLDPLDNKPATKGPGSMQEMLDQLFDRAKAQQAVLNKTRAELSKVVGLLTTAVNDVNKLKTDGRASKKELKEAREQVTTLQGEKEALDARVAKLTAEKKELTAEAADAKAEAATLREDKVTLTEELVTTKKMNEDLKKRLKGGAPTGGGSGNQEGIVSVTALTAGDKGKIIESNDELKFVIIDFSDDAIVEMLGAERQNQLPQLEMNVRRTGRQSAAGEFVTRIRLRQAVRGKNLVVADILSDWQQVTVEKGDVVFF
jgi:myosin heavy subunit